MKKLLLVMVVLSLCGCMKREMIGLQSKEEIEEAKKRETDTKAENLKNGDMLVAKWAEYVETKGTKHHEGITDVDPWGEQILITYKQEWFNEIATIKSAGPDTKFNTSDDLIRVRTIYNPSGILKGIDTVGWLIVLWVLSGICVLFFSNSIYIYRKTHNKRRIRDREHLHQLEYVIMLIFAPIFCIILGLQYFCYITDYGDFWGIDR